MNKNVHNSEKLNNLLNKRVKLLLTDGTLHIGILSTDEYSNRYKLNRDEMNKGLENPFGFKGPLTFYKSHVKKIEEF